MFTLIAAVADNGVIGSKNTLPWHLPEDLKRFKALTMGHHLIMGRKTWESLPHQLSGRTPVIVSHYPISGQITIDNIEDLIELVKGKTTYVIGGASIYEWLLPYASKMELTRVHLLPTGDTYFPVWSAIDWQRENETPTQKSSSGMWYTYETWIRN
jgi:dihydrofolate reductase